MLKLLSRSLLYVFLTSPTFTPLAHSQGSAYECLRLSLLQASAAEASQLLTSVRKFFAVCGPQGSGEARLGAERLLSRFKEGDATSFLRQTNDFLGVIRTGEQKAALSALNALSESVVSAKTEFISKQGAISSIFAVMYARESIEAYPKGEFCEATANQITESPEVLVDNKPKKMIFPQRQLEVVLLKGIIPRSEEILSALGHDLRENFLEVRACAERLADL